MAATTNPNAMTPQEFADLRTAVAKVQDNALQPVLVQIVAFLGRASGLDAASEDARLAKEAKEKAEADAKAAQEENDKANAEADAKIAEAQRASFVAMFGKMSAPAAGGMVTSPTATIVGEQGPETATPAPTSPTPAPKPTPDAPAAASKGATTNG